MANKNYLIKNLGDYVSLFKNINLCVDNRVVIFLKGELGSGKTTFVQNYLKYKYAFTNTTSPTFGIVNTYSISQILIYHYLIFITMVSPFIKSKIVLEKSFSINQNH